jgi:WD40 repeat protein
VNPRILMIVLSLCANNVSAGDQKQSKLSAFSNFSLVKAFSLAPHAPEKKSFDPLAVTLPDIWNIIEEYQAHNPHLFNKKSVHFFNGGWIYDTSWHPDGVRFAAARRSGGIKIWNRKTKQRITLADTHKSHTAIAYSNKGRLASISDNGDIKIWAPDIDKNKRPSAAWSTHRHDSLLFFDQNDTYLFSANMMWAGPLEQIKIWDIETQKQVVASERGYMTSQLAWLNNTTLIACQCYDEKKIRLYDIRNMQVIRSFYARFNKESKKQVAVLDDRTLLYNNSDSLRFLDLRKNESLPILEQKDKKEILSINVINEEQVVIMESVNNNKRFRQQNSLEAYDLQTGELINVIAQKNISHFSSDFEPIENLCPMLSPCGKAILASHAFDIYLWEQPSLLNALSS